MKISVVTACYNDGYYLNKTIESVIGQGYADLEYIIVDGGSNDNTKEIIEENIMDVDVFISEKDDGQYHAIQKGLDLANGDVLAWLNADDIYYPWTFAVVNEVFTKFRDVDWIIGLPSHINKEGHCTSVSNTPAALPREYIRNGWFRSHLGGYLQQESMFWRRSLLDKVDGLDLDLQYAADFKLWTDLACHSDLVSITVPLAAFRSRPGEQKSSFGRAEYEDEVKSVCTTLRRPNVLWDWTARQSIQFRSLCRLMIWKKCRVVAYSRDTQQWVLREMTRPVSRVSFSGLMLENGIRE